MASKRPKRNVVKQAIIEISDSETELTDGPPTKKVRSRKDKESDSEGDEIYSLATTQNHWSKSKDATLKANSSKPKRWQKDTNKTNETVSDFNNIEEEDVFENNSFANDSLPPTGRNSFWGRRKVWQVHELLAETTNIDSSAAKNIVNLFENENTIPFICRYRRDLVNHMTPEKLRDIKNTYTEIVNLRKKAEAIVTQLEKEKVIDQEIRTEVLSAKTTEELEFLYAPYKPASKGSLAERAKALGLQEIADRLLDGALPFERLESVVNKNNPDLDNVDKVKNGVCHIISHIFSKHTDVLEELRRLQKIHRTFLKSTKTKEPESAKKKATMTKNKEDKSKFELYFDWQCDVRYVKPYQILALNRGENLKFLKIKLITSPSLKTDLKQYIWKIFMSRGVQYRLRAEIFEKAFEECYNKKLLPLLTRQIRANLNASAKKASIDVFAKNLKQLLLMAPLKGERILGIDPGFTNGCKLALISETADVLETGVIYPHKREADPEKNGEILAKMLARHNCKTIALGNGTACRETEFWLTKLFDINILDSKTIRYSIVSEQGASIYSCSDVARKEFPNMDTNEISAVSIARRLNDPLSEYVKIEPRHIGVGMYQHDINDKALTESLNEVVSECVSFVGVDINTASISVLKHVAGLTEKKAEKIIQYRMECGPFKTRKDLIKVKTIGEKTFTQCAGFIRIEPRSIGGRVENLLDCTWVHPESYAVAKKIISLCKLRVQDIGNSDFISKIGDFVKDCKIDELAAEYEIPQERLEVILEALQRELFRDYRADFDKCALFKKGVMRLGDLSNGEVVTGAVSNVTDFGAFVDIGVECDGLIHISKMNNELSVGDRVRALIINVDTKRRRIALRLDEKLN